MENIPFDELARTFRENQHIHIFHLRMKVSHLMLHIERVLMVACEDDTVSSLHSDFNRVTQQFNELTKNLEFADEIFEELKRLVLVFEDIQQKIQVR